MDNYKHNHQHPANKLTHAIGIPLIILAFPVLIWSWPWALVLFVVGWIFQFIGHAFEGNSPSFFKNPLYLLICPLWIGKRLIAILRSFER